MDEMIKMVLKKLKDEKILGKGITAFEYNGIIDVYSKLNDEKIYFFKIYHNKIKIFDKTYDITNIENFVQILQRNSLKTTQEVLDFFTVDRLKNYREIYIIDYRNSTNSFSTSEYAEFETTEICFEKGHAIDGYNESIAFYLKGFLLGINSTEGVDIGIDSIAKKCAECGKPEDAILFFKKLIDWKLNEHSVIHLLISDSYSELKNYEKAIEHIEQYLTKIKTPSHTRPYFMRAKANVELNNIQRAIKDLEFVLSNSSKDYGLFASDVINNSDGWQYYNKFGESPYITEVRKLLKEIS